jgi:hypothetical protein
MPVNESPCRTEDPNFGVEVSVLPYMLWSLQFEV